MSLTQPLNKRRGQYVTGRSVTLGHDQQAGAFTLNRVDRRDEPGSLLQRGAAGYAFVEMPGDDSYVVSLCPSTDRLTINAESPEEAKRILEQLLSDYLDPSSTDFQSEPHAVLDSWAAQEREVRGD